MKSVAFYTLGCKVNQYETQAMRECFLSAGYTEVAFAEPADVYVINSCTVTNTGDKKSLKAVRSVHRAQPQAAIVLAGCLAQRSAADLCLPGVRLLLGTQNRGQVVTLLERALEEDTCLNATGSLENVSFEPLQVRGQEGHTRAVLKIQEGCDGKCAYCIIPSVRGPIRSRPIAWIQEEVRALAAAGYQEVVLTGIHLSSYGRDGQGGSLADAVEAVRVPGIKRIRLGSLEPSMMEDKLIQRLKAVDELCPHFHLSLQSGSDAVLKAMRRRYTTEGYGDAVNRLRQAFPDMGLTTDVITGFPTESQAHFEQSLEFIRRMGFMQIHVFPYSEREGTPAAAMIPQVPKPVRDERAKVLGSLARELGLQNRQARIGHLRPVLFEETGVGYTPEYVYVDAREGKPGTLGAVRLTGITENGMTGTLVQSL